jgi:hypothetical protein
MCDRIPVGQVARARLHRLDLVACDDPRVSGLPASRCRDVDRLDRDRLRREPGQDRQHRAGAQRDRGAGVGAVAEVCDAPAIRRIVDVFTS